MDRCIAWIHRHIGGIVILASDRRTP